MTARRGSAADALARMQRAATTGSPITRTPDTPSTPEATVPSPADVTSPAQAPAATTRPIRITVDLDPTRHRTLKIWAATHGVRSAEVIRALIALLDANPALAHAITDQIASDRDSLR